MASPTTTFARAKPLFLIFYQKKVEPDEVYPAGVSRSCRFAILPILFLFLAKTLLF